MFDNLKNMGKMVQQAQQMKKRMQEVQSELKKKEIIGQAENNQIQVKMNGELEVLDVKIEASLLNPDNVSKLEQGIKSAFSEATIRAKNIAAENLKKVTGGLNIPGLT
jgi:nucleoid-associated protein EbfC